MSSRQNVVYVSGAPPADLPQGTAEERSRRASHKWHFERDLTPLITVLAAGEAAPVEQRLAARLLEEATRRKLSTKRRNPFRKGEIIAAYVTLRRYYRSEHAKELVAERYGCTAKNVEKIVGASREQVETLALDLEETLAAQSPYRLEKE